MIRNEGTLRAHSPGDKGNAQKGELTRSEKGGENKAGQCASSSSMLTGGDKFVCQLCGLHSKHVRLSSLLLGLPLPDRLHARTTDHLAASSPALLLGHKPTDARAGFGCLRAQCLTGGRPSALQPLLQSPPPSSPHPHPARTWQTGGPALSGNIQAGSMRVSEEGWVRARAAPAGLSSGCRDCIPQLP